MQAAQLSFPDWRKIVPCKPSDDEPIVYQSKISKTNVIPIYRLAGPKGESQDIVCLLVDSLSFNMELETFSKQEIFPAYHLTIAGEPIVDHVQMGLDMIQNCKALGIEVQDGIKEDGWKPFSPTIVNKGTIPLDNLGKFYEKVANVKLEDVTTTENVRIQNPSEVPTTEVVTITESEKTRIIPRIEEKNKTVRVSVNPDESVSLNEPAFHFVPQPKGQRGRPRKVYDDPVFDALVRSIPHTVACKGCGKDIILAPLNIIDRARALKVEVSAMLSDYRCRSCK